LEQFCPKPRAGLESAIQWEAFRWPALGVAVGVLRVLGFLDFFRRGESGSALKLGIRDQGSKPKRTRRPDARSISDSPDGFRTITYERADAMKRLVTLGLLALGAACGSFFEENTASATDYIDIDEDSYAAIAYSPATGKLAFSYNYGSRSSAEKAALKQLDKEDGKIVSWVNNGFCALALGDEVGKYGTGYRWGDGASTRGAGERALAECAKRTTGARLVLVLSSDGQVIQKEKKISKELAGG
jgi:hypothetical protein